MTRIGRWIRGLEKAAAPISTICGMVGGGFTLVLMVWVTATVFARYAINKPIASSDEVSGFMFLCLVFLGMGYTLLSQGHIRLDLILGKTRGRVRQSFDIGSTFLGLTFAALLFSGMLGLTLNHWKQGTLSLGALRVPLVYPGIIASLGLLIFVLQFLIRLLGVVFRSTNNGDVK